MQITDDWKDACIQQEMDEIEKLEKFIQEEKARAHQVAEGINRKMIEAEKRRENLVEMKKQLKSDIKKRN